MRFSILTVVWNRSATIGQALDSLAGQTHEAYEHLIQDGGSTDGTAELLHRRAAGDARIKLVSGRDGGIYDALNRALARASGDVIGLLHSDDFFAHPRVLEQVAERFGASGAEAVYGDLDYVSAQDPSNVVRRWRAGSFSPARLRRGWMPPHPALFLRREVIERCGGYDTSFRIAADYDSILRYFGQGRLAADWLPEVLVKMRVGGASNRSLAQVWRKSAEDYRALRKNGVGGLGALAWKNLSKLGQFTAL
jgi:glycosyltransferase